MNDARYHRHFYSTPLYAPFDGVPRMFGVKPLPVVARPRSHLPFGNARTKRAQGRGTRDASTPDRVECMAPKPSP